MRVVAFTAGAAHMYCGSCLRDNALAAELKKQGHDIILVPIYTPTRTDEPNVTHAKVFLNGINVCLEQEAAFFRRPHRLLDKLWDAEWMLKLASKTSITVNPRRLGEMTVSVLRGEDGFQRKEIEKLTAWLRSQALPDVVTLPNSLLIGLARPIREALNRPVCCTLQGEDLFLSQLPEPYQSQALELMRANVRHVDGFAAVSDFSADLWLNQLRIPEHRMHVIPLGIRTEGYDPGGRAQTGPFKVGYFARVAPEKGLHVLAESYIRLRRQTDFGGSVLETAGYLAREHRGYLRGIERQMKEAGLADEFRYRGTLDREQKVEFLRQLHVLSVPCTYDEPKGISLLEAMACGVPVVQPRRGAFPEIVGKAGGGIIVEAGDAASLAEGLYRLWKDPALVRQLGQQGAQGVRDHFGVPQMAARALQAYRSIAEARVHA
ncbi:MAG: glycosyltransferase family 1 protein [Acidobacteriales bacterium]|nr:MAG: glycosyltransferase family 1 protein [Terriglobales bacterium]